LSLPYALINQVKSLSKNYPSGVPYDFFLPKNLNNLKLIFILSEVLAYKKGEIDILRAAATRGLNLSAEEYLILGKSFVLKADRKILASKSVIVMGNVGTELLEYLKATPCQELIEAVDLKKIFADEREKQKFWNQIKKLR
jgi:hypothetical protein